MPDTNGTKCMVAKRIGAKMYTKTVRMTLTEAIDFEVSKGFESKDEFKEVMMDIAAEYGVTYYDCIRIYQEINK